MPSNVVATKPRRRVRFPTRTRPRQEHHSPRAASTNRGGASDFGTNIAPVPSTKSDTPSDKPRLPATAPFVLSLLARKQRLIRLREQKSQQQAQEESSSVATAYRNQMESVHTDIPAIDGVPTLFTELRPIRDSLITATSKAQDEVVQQILPFLKGSSDNFHHVPESSFSQFGIPPLAKAPHVVFLEDALEPYPAKFVGLDASRPWLVYWAMTALYLLGEDILQYEKRVICTMVPMQNSTGGFGGGHGQMSHCAASYAIVLSLALTESEEAFKIINRLAFWKWLGQLKQPNGGFQVCVGGEEDVRGAYCIIVMIVLLDLPMELPPDAPARKFGHDTFISGLPEYISSCQTYEGGISGTPGTEAHGAYTFCALACLCLMGPPWEMIQRPPDSYHTCYTLAGLSSIQYNHSCTSTGAREATSPSLTWISSPFKNSSGGTGEGAVFEERDRLMPVHPVFVIPHLAVDKMHSWCESRPIAGFNGA
ncbi:CAAX farnesyltransferase (FTase) subunit beta [Myotisia sp. PD_48]|nr:CAAX farnesyltransferase (FTase) subunit beta [Myotisia sp. PD_48]